MDLIVTTCNDSEYLREALLSIIYGAQATDLVDRIVVVDDASRSTASAQVEAVVAEVERLHPNIMLLRNSENCGLSHSRNRGLRFCTSDYVSFLDADDLKPAGWGLLVQDILEAESPDYLFTGSAIIDDRYSFQPFYDGFTAEKLFAGETIREFTGHRRFLPLMLEPQIGSKYFKRATINAYQFPIGRKFEDLYLLARMSLDLDRVVGANVVTHLYNTTERVDRVTMTPRLKADIIGNAAGIAKIFGYYFDSRWEQIQANYANAIGRAFEAKERELQVLHIERTFAFAAIKFAFVRMLDWAVKTIAIGDIEDFVERVGRVFRTLPTDPSVAQVLKDLADQRTLEWYDNISHLFARADATYLCHVYA
jgi:glycosyltransferase involved in cell wall biosynthesis